MKPVYEGSLQCFYFGCDEVLDDGIGYIKHVINCPVKLKVIYKMKSICACIKKS